MQFERYKVFVSYSHSESDQLQALLQFLPPQLFDIYCDLDRLHAGWEWEPRLESMIQGADVLLVMVGADYEERPFLARELAIYTQAHVDSARVVPVLIDGCGDIPPRLAHYQSVDLRGADAYKRARTIAHSIQGAARVPMRELTDAFGRLSDPGSGGAPTLEPMQPPESAALTAGVFARLLNIGAVSANVPCPHRELDPTTMEVTMCDAPSVMICVACMKGSCAEAFHVYARFCTALQGADMFQSGTKLFFWCPTCSAPLCARCLGVEDDYPCPPEDVLSYRFSCLVCRRYVHVVPKLDADYGSVALECLRWAHASGPPGLSTRANR